MNTPSISTSPTLIQRIKKQERDAWERFVDIYTPLIYHWTRRVVLQDADAADIVQDILQAISTSVEKYDPNKGSGFRGWLWGITQNKLAQHRQTRAKNPPGIGGSNAQHWMVDIPEHPPSDPRAELVILARRAADLIKVDFEPQTYQAFWKTTIENQSPKDVAEELMMSIAAVYKAKSRVLAHLRRELEFPADL